MKRSFGFFLVIAFVSQLAFPSLILADEVATSASAVGDVYSLLGHGSSLELRSFQWTGNEQLRIRFSFQTRSYEGQLFRLIAKNENGEPVLDINAKVSRRVFHVDAEDFVDVNDELGKLIFPQTDISDGNYHQVVISINPLGGDLVIELGSDHRSNKLRFQKSANLDVSIHLGGIAEGATSSVHSAIGCIGKTTVDYGTGVTALAAEARKGDVQDGCLDACAGTDCEAHNPRGCLNYYLTSICDCAGTQKEGESCNKDPKVYNFDGGQYVAYELEHRPERRQPRRIRVSFKAQSDDAASVLLYAPLASEDNTNDKDALVVIINKRSIQILLRDVSILNASTINDLYNARWHDLTLDVNYPARDIVVKLDQEHFKSDPWGERSGLVLFREVYFGGYKEDVATNTNFIGCIRNAYVEHESISHLISVQSNRLKYGKIIIDGTCPLADFEDGEEQSQSISTIQTTTPSIEETTTTEMANVRMLDVPRAEMSTTTQQPKIGCNELRCEHDSRCFVDRRSGNAYCDCGDSGYAGKLCQFSKLPRTCDELYETGERRSGVFRIDPDGGDSAAPTLVKCEMKEQDGGVTLVDHNFVDSTYVRQAKSKGMVYSIIYRDMPPDALRALVANSDKCRQYFKYECNQAPLLLDDKSWFKSINQSFSAIGGSTDDKQCQCGRNKNCGIASKCACDVGEKQTLSDEGFNEGQLAGITEMTFLQNETSTGWAKVTLGPLKCGGSKGTKDAIQFRKSTSVLRFGKWKGRQLSFWIRTSIKNGRLFSQSSSNGRFFNSDLEDGHTLVFHVNFAKTEGNTPTHVRVVSQSPINDDKWHRIRIETLSKQIRFSIDNKVDGFYSLPSDDALDESTFDGALVLGGSVDNTASGYIGCIRQLILNDVTESLSSRADLPDGIVKGCQDRCASAECFNNAECIEDYEKDTYKCKCVNEYTYLPPDCKHDINKDTEVSFRDSSNGYILTRDFLQNPVSNNKLVFSFRTDQTSALLVFAHDQNYNMVQIHLVDGNRISLTVNYGKELKQCTITKETGDFSDMHWYQILVIYSQDHTSLYVDKAMCQIDGGRQISTEYLDEWEGDIQKLKVVFPPRSPVPPSQMPDYTLLYVGGVTRARFGPRRFLFRRQTSSQIVYTSPLPNLLGCVRGFVVGNEFLNLRLANKSGNIRDGCSVGCGDKELHCAYDGYCRVDWEGDQTASCDCAPTSYFGSNCTEDNGLSYEAGTYVQIDLDVIVQRLRLPEYRSYDSLSFAFSTDKSAAPPTTAQLMAYMEVNRDKNAQIYMQTDGQLVLEIREPDHHTQSQQNNTRMFIGKYNDGERHFVFLKFFGDKLIAKVDRQFQEIHRVKWRLSDVRTISIGGGDPKLGDYIPYTGCMSNALIEFRSSKPRSIKPFNVLLSSDGEGNRQYRDYVKYLPDGRELNPARCAQYTVDNPMPTEGPPTALPPFTAPMQTALYLGSTLAPGSPPPEEKKRGLGVAIGLAVVVIVVLICIAIYCYYVKCVKGKRRNQAQQPENGHETQPVDVIPEKQPFLGSPDDKTGNRGPPRKPPSEMTELPEANEDLEERSLRGSINERPPGYAPTNTPPYNPHADAKDHLQKVDRVEFAPAPSDEELKALSPTVRRNASVKKGAFVYGLPDSAYVDNGIPSSPRSPLQPKPPVPRRMPVDVAIPKI